MTGLNSDYVAAFSFNEVILDKDNAFPLSNGLVYFYRDSARTELKPVYQLVSGSTYTYEQLPNPIKLSSIGTFQDNSGNDIVPYFYPQAEAGELDLYYVEVYSSLDGITPAVLQYTREAMPSSAITEAADSSLDIKNYISDGQFLLHQDIGASATTVAGEVVGNVRVLSQGGWTYERSVGTSAKDIILFNKVASAVTNPSGSPKYICNVICQVPDVTTAFKALRVKFNDVNKFYNNTCTFGFTARSNSGVASVSINLIKNFGTGGSPSAQTSTSIISSVVLPSTYTQFHHVVDFGNNIGKTLGTNGDDYLQIEISFPSGSAFDMEITDVFLVPGDVNLTAFPVMTNEEMIGRSIAGWAPIPNPDGSDLYLPIKLSPTGLMYDDSDIGKVYSTLNTVPGKGELPMDGSRYKTSDYSSDLIPYARLQKKLWNSACQTPVGGTGTDYMTAIFANTALSTANELIVTNNDVGSVTDTADGTPATGFTFQNIHNGSAANYHVLSYIAPKQTSPTATPTVDRFLIECLEQGDGNTTAGTSGFNVIAAYLDHEGQTSLLRNIDSVQTVAATALAGKYFTMMSPHNGAPVNYYVWYKTNGTGSDPAPGGTGILVNLNTTDTAEVVAIKTCQALNGWQNTSIKTVAGSAIPAGSYFITHCPSGSVYVVWYKVGGVGTAPTVSNSTLIMVDISSSDTNIIVASKTQAAINSMFFAVPDFRGLFLRSTGGSLNQWDLYANQRYSVIPGYYGDVPATYQLDQLMLHTHTYLATDGDGVTKPVGTTGGAFNNNLPKLTTYTGQYENRPVSASVNYIIKY